MKTPSLWKALLLALLLYATIYQVQSMEDSPEIVDLFSNPESCDVTIMGNVSGLTLGLDLLFSEKTLQSQKLVLDGPGTWVIVWREFEAEEGSYKVCAKLFQGKEVVAEKCFTFYHGAQVPIRFDVRDFQADSKGMHLAIYSWDPAIVEIKQMLISNNKALYVSQEDPVSIGDGMVSPTTFNWEWKLLLEDDKEYAGRVKIEEKTHHQIRAFMNSFVAKEDASITETYEDEMGASATVLGNSQVPFQGKLLFELSHNASLMETIEKKTPVLLLGDDETVEVSWNQTLEPGVYHLKILLLGKDGDLMDQRESIIEAEEATRQQPVAQPEKKSPAAPALAAAAAIALGYLLCSRRGD